MKTLKKAILHDNYDKQYFTYNKVRYFLDEYLRPNTMFNNTDRILHANDEHAPDILSIEHGIDDYVLIKVGQ